MTVEDLYQERLSSIAEAAKDALRRACDGIDEIALKNDTQGYVHKQIEHCQNYLKQAREVYNEYWQIHFYLKDAFNQVAENVSVDYAVFNGKPG